MKPSQPDSDQASSETDWRYFFRRLRIPQGSVCAKFQPVTAQTTAESQGEFRSNKGNRAINRRGDHRELSSSVQRNGREEKTVNIVPDFAFSRFRVTRADLTQVSDPAGTELSCTIRTADDIEK